MGVYIPAPAGVNSPGVAPDGLRGQYLRKASDLDYDTEWVDVEIPSIGSTDAVPEGSVNLYFTNARARAAAPVQSVAGRTGDVTLSAGDLVTGTLAKERLPSSGATPGTYGSSSQVPVLIVDAAGRITSASTAPANEGPPGAAATVAVGSVTTGAPGSSAAVTNTGSSSAAVLAFTIPRGDAGAAGANGTNGTNGTAATVAVGSVTTGAAGSSASVTNTGTSSAAVFAFTIPRGDTGATGATGATGPAGPVAGSSGQLVYNHAGSAAGATVGPGLSFSGGVLSASGSSAGANLYLNANFI